MEGTPAAPSHALTNTAGAAQADQVRREMQQGYGVLVLFAGLFACLAAVVYSMSGSPDVWLSHGRLSVRSGAYGKTVDVSRITELVLVRSLSGLGRKRNAHQFGSTYAGRFEMKPYGDAMLFVDATKPPPVLVRTGDGVLLFNARDSVATKAVFDSLTVLRTAR